MLRRRFQTVLWVLAGIGAAALAAAIWIWRAPDSVVDLIRPHLPQTADAFLPPILPPPREVRTAHWLEQGWTGPDRHWFHHATQGTSTFPVPYDWFVALEQPSLRPAGLMIEPGYLERLGFMSSPRSLSRPPDELRGFGYGALEGVGSPADQGGTGVPPWRPVDNSDGLPVGFARTTGAVDAVSGKPTPDQIGLTCAACHAGQVVYKGVSLRFDGGPGMIDLNGLERVIGLAVLYTQLFPARFERFAARVLKDDATPERKAGLRQALEGVVGRIAAQAEATNSRPNTHEGFGRLDALNRIGNQIFYTDYDRSGLTAPQSNFAALNAPVSYPAIWNAPWFLWAQYDASILQPLVRNAGEALGVAAPLNLSANAGADLYRSSVALGDLVRIETMLRGDNPIAGGKNAFSGLSAPAWPANLFPDDPAWKIDEAKKARGRELYAQRCAGCHLGPLHDPAFDERHPTLSIWAAGSAPGTMKHWIDLGGPHGPALRLSEIPVAALGTDPEQTVVLATRKVDVPAHLGLDPKTDLADRWGCKAVPPGGATMLFSVALMGVVQKVVDRSLDAAGTSAEDRHLIWGPRGNCPNPTGGIYKARPLNGVWATAPYLHNGSVPSLFWLLSPAAERPKEFCLGARDFDPKDVGYAVSTDCLRGETRFSASPTDGSSGKGNGVGGHSFESGAGAGVLGPGLSIDERYDLIEYLKTL